MGQSEALTGARGQIIWIAALVLSTTTVIYLERLDIGSPPAPVPANLAVSAKNALEAAEGRHKAAPQDAEAASALVLALAVAVQAGALDAAEGKARAAVLLRAGSTAPEWASVSVLIDLTFGGQPVNDV